MVVTVVMFVDFSFVILSFLRSWPLSRHRKIFADETPGFQFVLMASRS
jgi:hypothetical protein